MGLMVTRICLPGRRWEETTLEAGIWAPRPPRWLSCTLRLLSHDHFGGWRGLLLDLPKTVCDNAPGPRCSQETGCQPDIPRAPLGEDQIPNPSVCCSLLSSLWRQLQCWVLGSSPEVPWEMPVLLKFPPRWVVQDSLEGQEHFRCPSVWGWGWGRGRGRVLRLLTPDAHVVCTRRPLRILLWANAILRGLSKWRNG